MSIFDELAGDTEEHGSGSSVRPKSIVDELTGKDGDDEADAAEKETQAQAQDELGQAALVAIKGNDAKALYRALADILANEG